MSLPRRYLTLLVLITLIPSSLSVLCDACEGNACKTGGCIGDYCVKSYYSPRFGSGSLLKERIIVKGCMNGTMLAENIKSQCYVDEDDSAMKLCICDGKRCTSARKQPKTEETKKITCKCKGTKGCDDKGECTGDMCVWTQTGKSITMGCMDLSVPLVERRAVDSCMMPPMTGSMHFHALGAFTKDLLDTESCICSTDNCNKKKPFVLTKEQEKMDNQSCNRTVTATIKGNKLKTGIKKCVGEFCYRMGINVKSKERGQLTAYFAEGCATFNPERTTMDDEFGTGECAEYAGNDLKMRTCFTTKDADAKERLEQSLAENGEEEEGEGEEGNEGGDESDEEEVTLEVKEPIKVKDGRSNGKKEKEEEREEKEKEEKEIEEEEEEEGEKEEKEESKEEAVDEKNTGEGKDSRTTKNFVWMAPTEAPTPDESNATMITVFVLIILCICVAGITWKFQLHRKLMRANYDTVAGG